MLDLLAAAVIATAPAVPEPLKPPPNEVQLLRAQGRGMQIYACVTGDGAPGLYAWRLKAPAAALFGSDGQQVARHSAGPAWEGPDGGMVAGEVAAKAPSPDPSAIDWLLLNAKSANGIGVLGRTRHVQRLSTVGGRAPEYGCDAGHSGAEARAPYAAEYVFYGAP
jgi:hypothetical protein